MCGGVLLQRGSNTWNFIHAVLYLCGFLVFQKKKSQGDADTLYSFPSRQGEICLSENCIVYMYYEVMNLLSSLNNNNNNNKC